MFHLRIGVEYPAMTAAILLPAMNAITVKIATVIIARSVRHIARYAIRQFVWAALMSAQIVSSPYASNVQPLAANAKQQFVKIVSLKKEYVITV